MAKCIVQPVVPVLPNEYVLTLNQEEAETLRTLFNYVGGHPDTTGRGLICSFKGSVGEALRLAGVQLSSHRASGEVIFHS